MKTVRIAAVQAARVLDRQATIETVVALAEQLLRKRWARGVPEAFVPGYRTGCGDRPWDTTPPSSTPGCSTRPSS